MTAYSTPSVILSIEEESAVAKIQKDERQPFGSLDILLNQAGLERFAGLIDEHHCNGLSLHHSDYGPKKSPNYFRPDLGKVNHPENILALTIDGVGRFAPDFDFDTFKRFENVRSLTLGEIPTIDKMTKFFPKLEVLRLFGWAKNKTRCQEGLWPHLRCLHIVSFRGDLSIFAGWNIQVLFLHHSRVEPFSSLLTFPELKTFAAESLNSDIDLAVLSDTPHLKHLSLRRPRRPIKLAGFTSRTLEMTILDKVISDTMEDVDLVDKFSNLKIYGLDLGKKRRLDRWDGFKQYGDPFASVSFIRPYAPE